MAMSKPQQTHSKEQLLTDIDDKILLCSICMERFKSPKILPCFHTYCEPCLSDWVKASKGNLICPTCKQSWPMTCDGVPGIPNNRFMNDLLELVNTVGSDSKLPQCEGCDRTSTHWCRDCDQFFCGDCIRAHEVVKALKCHQLLSMEEYITKKETERFALLKPRFCDIHPNNHLEFFCNSCLSPVCLKCTIVKHRAPSHDVIQLEDAIKKYQPSLEARIETLGSDVQKWREAKNKKTEDSRSLGWMADTTAARIKDAVQKICQAAKKEEARLLAELKQTHQQKTKEIHAQLEDIDTKLGNAESMHSYLTHVIKYGTAVDILSAKKASDDVNAKPFDCDVTGGVNNFDLVFEESDYTLPTNIGRVVIKPHKQPKGDYPVTWYVKSNERGWVPKPRIDIGTPKTKDIGTPKVKDIVKPTAKDNRLCAFCMRVMKMPTVLPCKHKVIVCGRCVIEQPSYVTPSCPTCKVTSTVITGNMPPGSMTHRVASSTSIPGYEGCSTFIISYRFKSGTQGLEHPNPGQPYTGTTRTAYLPNNSEGREVLRLLKIAFERRLTFTIGTSRTTGRTNTVIWNGIHHKTSVSGGLKGYGYPDPGYLGRVKADLAAKGVTKVLYDIPLE